MARICRTTADVFKSCEDRVGLAAFALAWTVMMAHGALAHDFKIGDLEIEHPWSRATPAGATVAGGYLVVRNNGLQPDRLVSVTGEIAARAQIHEMAVTNGIMTMRPVNGGLEIPAKGEVALKPGGFHLMFLELKRGPKAGDTFSGTLTFERAGSVDVTFAVDSMGAKGPDDAKKHDHGTMDHQMAPRTGTDPHGGDMR